MACSVASPYFALRPVTAAMLLGGIMEPLSPVPIKSAIKTKKFGAKAAANMQVPIRARPVKATGRRPKESEKGYAAQGRSKSGSSDHGGISLSVNRRFP